MRYQCFDTRTVALWAIVLFGVTALGCEHQHNAARTIESSPSVLEAQNRNSGRGDDVAQDLASPVEIGKEYDVVGEEPLRDGPSEHAGRKINVNASNFRSSSNIVYYEIDSSVTVRVQRVQGPWAEVQVTQPAYLSTSHRGWVPSSCLKAGATSKLDGWVRHECLVYNEKSLIARPVGYLTEKAALSVASDGSGWVRIIFAPIKRPGTKEFVEYPDYGHGLFIEEKNFTTIMPGQWK